MLENERPNRIFYTASTLIKTALLSGIAAVGLMSSALAGEAKAESYLAVWASDKETDDNHLDPDF
ncbi:MAG: hypothetical protein JO358_10275, partial [Alphaproteobacteria bacterium]|nr:hypothetical protein [Alphaproteobacteria bacterium]